MRRERIGGDSIGACWNLKGLFCCFSFWGSKADLSDFCLGGDEQEIEQAEVDGRGGGGRVGTRKS